MFYLFRSNKYLVFFILILFFTIKVNAQRYEIVKNFWFNNWKVDLRGGVANVVTDIPTRYLRHINFVNIPTNTPGSDITFSVKKVISSNIDIGYQFDYVNVKGTVPQNDLRYKVATQAFQHNFILGYNFFDPDKTKSKINFGVYYKVGGISLKNFPQLINSDGSIYSADLLNKNKFLSNIAVLTGAGLNINYKISEKIKIESSFEINRSSDNGFDIYNIPKVFYNSPNTVNKYITSTIGLSYSFDFQYRYNLVNLPSKKDYEARTHYYRSVKQKKKLPKSNYSIWYKK